MDIKAALVQKMKTIPRNGPNVVNCNFLLNTSFNQEKIVLDNFSNREEIIQRSQDFEKIMKYTTFEPEFLIPAPDEIEMSDDELLVPFPIFIESPMINPCIRKEKLLLSLLDKAGKLEPSELKIVIELIALNPELLPRKYFLENL